MIDTNKLREFAVKIGADYPLVSNYMEDSAQEIERLRELVKRHEAALDAVWDHAHNWEFTQKNDYGTGVRTFGINTRARFDQWVIRNGFDDPIAAIEAAMQEGK